MRRALLLLLALFASLAAPARAWARDITIRDYRIDAVVNRDGTTDVTETLRVYFTGTWNGIFRDISLQHMTAQGVKAKLDIDVLAVTDGAGQDLRFWREKPDGWTRRVRIAVPGASDAERTVVIRYRVSNAVRYAFAADSGGAHDELYWNATGNSWAFPIEHVLARIVLPAGVDPTDVSAYTGYSGSKSNDAAVSVRGNVVTAEVTRTLASSEGLTVSVSWPPGILPRPSEAELRTRRYLALWPLFLPLLAFFGMLRRWSKHGRDPREQPVAVGYAPPDGMTPAELGTLVDNKADLRDITSTLVDLAVRGFVGIEEVQEKHLFGLLSSQDWRFHQLTDSTTGLQTHERRFLDALFTGASDGPAWGVVKEGAARAAAGGGGGVSASEFVDAAPATQPCIRLSELKNKFYASLPGIRTAIFERLIERGYYLKRPDTVKGAWVAGGIVLCFLSVIGAVTLADSGWAWFNPVAVAVGGLTSGLVVLLFGLAMAARTEKGARAREAALGFREFLSKVESDRYRRMITGPQMFERYLPHAMAFGVEGRWASAFENLYREPPDWYAGSGGYNSFSASHFSSQMSGLGSSAASTMSSSPSSSGSGGGGSSGGGSGGGGGGGW
ncbi:DUF2207 domain-containing protein [Longimicrobium sp.]|uniref:DUF2207 domain-containing protein n=1 Tax=Longimicrobium sp. TaxID=2029185 RepID=UPI002B73E393|nr:DUF2207 domain-containing protein [Longimicrobium sp.]HSU17046.1 DUF2207 domain-containing protein [Longimicrobium sp.]